MTIDDDDVLGEAHALTGLGEALLAGGRIEEALAYLNEASQMGKDIGEHYIEARTELALGQLCLTQNAGPEAVEHITRCLTLSRDHAMPLRQAHALKVLATAVRTPVPEPAE